MKAFILTISHPGPILTQASSQKSSLHPTALHHCYLSLAHKVGLFWKENSSHPRCQSCCCTASSWFTSTHYCTSNKTKKVDIERGRTVPTCETASTLAAGLSTDHLFGPQRLRKMPSAMVAREKSSLGGKDWSVTGNL